MEMRWFYNRNYQIFFYFFLFFNHFSRYRVRQRNAGRSSPSFTVSDTAVSIRAPCKQVFMVPDTGDGLALLHVLIQPHFCIIISG